MKANNKTHQSASRALSILMSFVPNNREISISEIAKQFDLSLSTASRLVHLLSDQGFLRCDHWTKKYSLGKSVFDLGSALSNSLTGQIISISKPYIDELRDLIQEAVALEVLLDKSSILAYVAYGSNRIDKLGDPGNRMHVNVAAGAKAIMAFSPPEFVDSLLDGQLQRLTPNTITDRKVLKKRLAEFRRDGVAYDFGEGDPDIYAIGVPIFNHTGKAVAALTAGGFAHRMKGKFNPKLILLLKKTASKISERMLYETGNDLHKARMVTKKKD
jgi:DNA-binding IclR family transcriptional regulator